MKVEVNVDEQQIIDKIINDLKKHSLIGTDQNITVVYNAESNNVLYTVKEVSEILKTNVNYVHMLRKSGLLPFLKLGAYKVRKSALEEFLAKYEGYDITDPLNVVELEHENINNE